MAEILSDELQKYYSRERNRIIFVNGMTLNQLAWEIWERLGYKSVDPSVLSRVLKGERLFTLKQLEIFCKILRLSISKKQQLKDILYFELRKKFGLDEIFFEQESKHFLDLVEDNLKKIKRVRAEGLPILSAEWAENLYERIHTELELNHDTKKRKLLLKPLTELIIEQTEHLVEIELPNRVYLLTLKLTNELKKIGKELGGKNLIGKAHYRLGDSLYVNCKHKAALRYYKLGIKSDASRFYKNSCLREAAICQSYLGNQNEFEAIKPKLTKKISSLTLDERFQIFERISRAEANLGHPQAAYKALLTAEKIHKKNKVFRQLREIQLASAKIEMALLSKSSTGKNYLEKVGGKAIEIAQEHGYVRHQHKIENLLDQILN